MPFLAPVFTGIIGAVSGAASFLGGGGILAGIARMGLGIAAKYALGALIQPKAQAQGVKLETTYGEDIPREVILGWCGTAGHQVYRNAHSKGNRNIGDVYAVSHFRVTGMNRVRYEGEWHQLAETVTSDLGRRITGTDADIFCNLFTGRMDQAASTRLISTANPSGRWTTNHRGAGVAYVFVPQILDREKLPQPWQAFFEIQGAPLYDWRKDSTVGGSGAHRWADQDTWEFSENPVLMMYALERGIYAGTELIVGKGVPASRLPLAEWTLAANVCDEVISGHRRYTAGMIAGAGMGVTHDANMQPLLEACAATWVEDASGEYPIVGAVQTPLATFTDDDIMVDEPFRFSRFRTRSELVNTVAGTWRDPEDFYAAVPFTTRIDTDALAEDRERLAASVPYGAVNKAQVADRLADIAIRASRYQANAEICLHPKFLDKSKPGRWITWNSARYGTRTFQILEKRLGALGERGTRNVYLTLQEVGAGIFDPTEYETAPVIPTPPGEPDYAAEAENFAAIAISFTTDGGQIVPALQFDWDAFDDVTVVAVEIEYRKAGSTDAVSKVANVPATVLRSSDGVLSNVDMEYRHRLVTSPVRATFWTDWATVHTTEANAPDVSVGLGNIQDDVRAVLRNLHVFMDDIRAELELLALDASDAAGVQVAQTSVAARFRNATAAAMSRLTASVTEIDGQLVAQAEALTAVEASVGLVSADGLFRLYAEAGVGDVVARFVAQVRATLGDEWVSAGYVMEAGFTGGNPAAPFSRFLINASQFVVTDGSNEGYPLVFEGGVLKLQVANIGLVTAGVIQSPDGKFKISVGEGKIEWFE